MLPPKARATFKILFLFFPVAVFLLLEGCTTRVQQPAPIVARPPAVKPQIPVPTATKVGLLVPLSGPNRELGKSLQNAAELAFFEKGHENLELVIEDTLGTPEGARLATQKVLDKGVGLIVGPLFSAGALECAKLAAPRQVPVLSFTNDKKVAGPQVFALGLDPQEQIDRVLAFAEKRGKKTLVAYIPQNAYGVLVEQGLRQQEKRGAITLKHLETYDPQNPSNLSVPKIPGADLLLIAEGGHNLSRVVSALLYHENELEAYQLLGTGQWDTPAVRSNHSLIGAWFAAPNPAARHAYEEKFQQTYGYMPPRLATLAYDAVSMIFMLSKRFPSKPFAPESLTQQVGFLGLDGLFRLKPDGTVQRGLSVLEVRPEAFQVIDSMPKKF